MTGSKDRGVYGKGMRDGDLSILDTTLAALDLHQTHSSDCF